MSRRERSKGKGGVEERGVKGREEWKREESGREEWKR